METEGTAPVIERLTLTDFRNYACTELRPSPRFNIVSGPNAQGKTNLLEAIHLVSTGRLLRGVRDARAIRNEAETAAVEAELAGTGTTVRVELQRRSKRRAMLNGASLPRPSDLLGRVPTVSFSSLDLLVVRGEPSDRRHFLDSELAQIYPAYLRHLSVYKRAKEQRNALLKVAQDSFQADELFEVWEGQLAEHGTQLRSFRRRWIEGLSPLAAEAHAALGGGELLALSYVCKGGDGDAADLASSLSESRSSDVLKGFTTVGPHRDDVQIDVAGLDARHYGSQGQQRTAVIALKLAVMRSATEVLGFPPVLLLDDVFSDLDKARRASLVGRAIDQGGQVFLTCTESEQAGVELFGRSKVFRVVSGSVEEA